MPTLYVLSGPELGRSFSLETASVLGRGEDCDVTLRAASISRRHARLEPTAGGWIVHDLGSRNGLFDGAERVPSLTLTDGTLFRLGDVELRFREEALDEELEFDDAHEEAEEPDLSAGVEIVLENEEALDAQPPAAPAPPASARPASEPPRQPSAAAAARRAAAVERAGARAAVGGAAERVVQDKGRPVLRYSNEPDRAGFFGADLAQYPAWVRFAAALLALGFFAAIFYAAFWGTGFLKQQGS